MRGQLLMVIGLIVLMMFGCSGGGGGGGSAPVDVDPAITNAAFFRVLPDNSRIYYDVDNLIFMTGDEVFLAVEVKDPQADAIDWVVRVTDSTGLDLEDTLILPPMTGTVTVYETSGSYRIMNPGYYTVSMYIIDAAGNESDVVSYEASVFCKVAEELDPAIECPACSPMQGCKAFMIK